MNHLIQNLHDLALEKEEKNFEKESFLLYDLVVLPSVEDNYRKRDEGYSNVEIRIVKNAYMDLQVYILHTKQASDGSCINLLPFLWNSKEDLDFIEKTCVDMLDEQIKDSYEFLDAKDLIENFFYRG